jgi:hypothetical protein
MATSLLIADILNCLASVVDFLHRLAPSILSASVEGKYPSLHLPRRYIRTRGAHVAGDSLGQDYRTT